MLAINQKKDEEHPLKAYIRRTTNPCMCPEGAVSLILITIYTLSLYYNDTRKISIINFNLYLVSCAYQEMFPASVIHAL
jgi:hypothetical protein